ncbi:hypothetical protein [Tsukamurella sp. NPDC003166]|uniref:hypothetical protein n=1 Tax=Tsukamurella sp. NPDC003166 TaxID=3154444 RepID=UPI0033B77C97
MTTLINFQFTHYLGKFLVDPPGTPNDGGIETPQVVLVIITVGGHYILYDTTVLIQDGENEWVNSIIIGGSDLNSTLR